MFQICESETSWIHQPLENVLGPVKNSKPGIWCRDRTNRTFLNIGSLCACDSWLFKRELGKIDTLRFCITTFGLVTPKAYIDQKSGSTLFSTSHVTCCCTYADAMECNENPSLPIHFSEKMRKGDALFSHSTQPSSPSTTWISLVRTVFYSTAVSCCGRLVCT